MAVEGIQQIVPGIKTATDLSLKQFRFVKMSADFTVAIASAATDCPLGVLQDNPLGTAGKPQAASVACFGVTKVVLGGTVSAGSRVGTDANGAAVAYVEGTDTTKYEMGIALEAGVATDIRSILLTPLGHRAS